MRLPQSFKNAVAAAAKSLNHSFKVIGALPSAPGLELSERNTLVHLGASFLAAGFGVCAGPQSSASANRIDLVVSNQKIAFALSVQALEKLLPGKILKQAQALKDYKPRPRLDSGAAVFWQQPERWAAILIQSFAGEKLNELWRSQSNAPETFEQSLRQFSQLDNAGKEDFSELASCLRTYEAYVGLEPICSELERPGERLDLLWAAFPLSV